MVPGTDSANSGRTAAILPPVVPGNPTRFQMWSLPVSKGVLFVLRSTSCLCVRKRAAFLPGVTVGWASGLWPVEPGQGASCPLKPVLFLPCAGLVLGGGPPARGDIPLAALMPWDPHLPKEREGRRMGRERS